MQQKSELEEMKLEAEDGGNNSIWNRKLDSNRGEIQGLKLERQLKSSAQLRNSFLIV